MTSAGSGASDRQEPATESRPIARRDLPEQVADLVGDVSEPQSPTRVRRLVAATARVAGRGGQVTWRRARTAGQWLADQVIAMAPRLPVRDQATLRRQFPGYSPEELADALIRGSSRAAASVGAAVGAAAVLPVIPAVPVEIATETLVLVGIEIKLIAELHEVYGMHPPGSAAERMAAYVAAWAHRRGVGLAPGGIVLAIGSPLRRRLQRRLLARAGRSATSLGPMLTGALAGAALNRHETRRLGHEIRADLRQRSPNATHWPARQHAATVRRGALASPTARGHRAARRTGQPDSTRHRAPGRTGQPDSTRPPRSAAHRPARQHAPPCAGAPARLDSSLPACRLPSTGPARHDEAGSAAAGLAVAGPAKADDFLSRDH